MRRKKEESDCGSTQSLPFIPRTTRHYTRTHTKIWEGKETKINLELTMTPFFWHDLQKAGCSFFGEGQAHFYFCVYVGGDGAKGENFLFFFCFYFLEKVCEKLRKFFFPFFFFW